MQPKRNSAWEAGWRCGRSPAGFGSGLLLGAAVLVATAGGLRASVQESFESPQPTWRLADADCPVEVLQQTRTFAESHGGKGCEQLTLRSGSGTYVHLVHDVTPARVIAELCPRLWIKADRSGLQLFARVVLPRSLRQDGQPLTALLPGDSYRDVGVWRPLRVPDIERELERQVRVLRSQFGSQVDAREAYIDLVVLNAYGGAGVTRLWVDDLELEGYASAAAMGRLAAGDSPEAAPPSLPAAGGSPLPITGTAVRLDGSVLTIDGRPFFPRVIERNEESLEWLQRLGFNVVKLAGPPMDADLAEAERLGLWLIAPPPVGTAPARGPAATARILAWTLGEGLTRGEIAATRELARVVRSDSVSAGRLLACDVVEDFGRYGDVADVIVLRRDTLGTSFPLARYGDWLGVSRSGLPRGVPFWVSIETELPERLVQQMAALSGGAAPVEVVEPRQLQLLAAEAVAAGARGFCFRSRSRLDLPGPAATLRAATLQLLNRELSPVEPWIAGGSLVEEIEVSDAETRARVLETQRARMVVVTQLAAGQQFVAGPSRTSAMSFQIHGTPITDQTFLLGTSRLELLRGARGSGVRIGLEAAQPVSWVLLTQEPLAINHVRRKLAERGSETVELRLQIASVLLAQTEQIDRQIAVAGQSWPPAAALLARSKASLDRAGRLLQTGDLDNAARSAADADQALCEVRRAHWEHATQSFPSPLTSPLTTAFANLPLHWQLASRLAAARWQPTALPGGDFEDLDHMVASGWLQRRAASPAVQTAVELSYQNPRGGQSSLHLQAWTERAAGSVPLDDWPVTVVSAPVPLLAGRLVRIHGWANVPGGVRDSLDGLLIIDSLGGPPLAERIGQTKGWQEFTLYRVATRGEPLTITFALTGLGEVWLDDVTVSAIE